MSFQPGAALYTQGFGTRPENVEVPILTTRAPLTSDIRYPIGKRWLDESGLSEYSLAALNTSAGVTTATWIVLGGGSSDVSTLTGNTGGAVPPTAGNINIVGSSTSGITFAGNPATSTLTASLNSYSSQTVTTTDATPNSSMTIALGSTPGVYTFDINISAFDTTDIAGAGFSLFGTVRTTGSAGTLVGVPDKIVNQEAAMSTSDATITVSGNNAVIQVTGVASKTIDWRAITFYTFVS